MKFTRFSLFIVFLLSLFFISCRFQDQKRSDNVFRAYTASSIEASQSVKDQVLNLVYNYFSAIDQHDLLGFVSLVAPETIIANMTTYDTFQQDESKIKVKEISSVLCLTDNGPCEIRLTVHIMHGLTGQVFEFENSRLIVTKQANKWVVLVPY